MRVMVTLQAIETLQAGRTLLEGQCELMTSLGSPFGFLVAVPFRSSVKNAKRGSISLFDSCQRSNSSYYFYLHLITHINKTVITKLSSSVGLEYLSCDLYIR